MRDWDQIVSGIAFDEGVTKAEADVIYRKRIAEARGEVYTPDDSAKMRPETNRAARRANAKEGRRNKR
jgi:hypothetical protein